MASTIWLTRALLILLTTLPIWIPDRAAAQTRQVNLEILVISQRDLGTDMIKAGLGEALIPFREVDLTAANRPLLDEAFLVERPSSSVRRGRYQAIVLPNEAPTGLSARERSALAAYQREFRVRQLDAYVYPSEGVHLTPLHVYGYSGYLDGAAAQLTEAARQAGFAYLRGPIPFDDLSPRVGETYGHLARPLPDDGPKKRRFVPFLTAAIPGTGEQSVMLGVLDDDGREEMVLSVGLNAHQIAQQALFPGIVHWLTQGIHLGVERNYLAVHVDDVFLADARWLPRLHCTANADCNERVTASNIQMTPDDVHALLAFQRRTGLKLDMVFNGYGFDRAWEEDGRFDLGDELLAHKDELRWISHTYSHLYLGCQQDLSVRPWRCKLDRGGRVLWTSYDTVYDELMNNLEFARRVGLDVDRDELVTGEHSGLRRTPLEPGDNPHLLEVLDDLNIDWIASDNSRDDLQRALGDTLTVPRYPLNVFHNVGTKAEEISEYNWIYTVPEHGGSGLCLSDPKSTCIAPIDQVNGFDDYIVPQQAREVLQHVLSNSPRPHYAHQSNLAEERLLYPVLERVLAAYEALFQPSFPIVNASMAELGTELKLRSAWERAGSEVRAYVEDGRVIVRSPRDLEVPITAPSSSLDRSFTSLGELRTGWLEVRKDVSERLGLPAQVRLGR